MADLRHRRTPAGTDHSGSELQALHLSDVELELYSLNRLHPAFHPPMEEHLLWCKECANRLEEFDLFHAVIRKTLAGHHG